MVVYCYGYSNGKVGINKTILGKLGGTVHCFMSDPDVAEEAKHAMSHGLLCPWSVQLNCQTLHFCHWKRPYCLITLHGMIEEGNLDPALIIGVPVGFVNVVE